MKKINYQKIKSTLSKSLVEDNLRKEADKLSCHSEEELLKIRSKEMNLAKQIWIFHQDYSETPRDVEKTPEEFANDAITLYADAVLNNNISGRNSHEPLENFNLMRKFYVALLMLNCAL